MPTTQQMQLTAYPAGEPNSENFRIAEVELDDLAEGQVRVKNHFLSVDPYMLGRFDEDGGFPFKLNGPLGGAAIGEVVESRSDDLPVGTVVQHFQGWRTMAQGKAKSFAPRNVIDGVPSSAYLGMLGLNGKVAYVVATRVAKLKKSSRVFVSAAGGGVGTAALQFARRLGATEVYGSAGGPKKVADVQSRLDYDKVFDYKAEPIGKQLFETLGEDSIDIYFDAVGGEQLDAVLRVMDTHGVAGMYGSLASSGPKVQLQHGGRIVDQSLKLQGIDVSDYTDEIDDEFYETVSAWLAEGSVIVVETVFDGLDAMPKALQAMMNGENIGKTIVRL